jgi:hypothetical protein
MYGLWPNSWNVTTPGRPFTNWTKLMTGIKPLVVVAVALISCLLYGCDRPLRQLSGGYYLERFDEGGASFFVETPGKSTNGGGVFDGSVREIGWNDDLILARVNRVYNGDPDGWYVLYIKTGRISGPLQLSELKANSAFSSIKTMEPKEVFSRHQ